jgi:hypothetical protein
VSNKRRKSIGQAKLLRNKLIREFRGSAKRGGNMPGGGSQYFPPDGWVLSSELERRRDLLHEQHEQHVEPYWRGQS